ncbi:MAG: TetR family transcriptional regulator [Chloroflexi bacterium]|nr:TetR family transcriptional regulator [Chloroflexota bacterium]
MSRAPRPARPARTGRRPGAPATRDRILEAARAAFGEAGFEGTTIRGVAARALVDPALVHHYFGSKQQLFVAAMELPVDFGAIAPRLLEGPPEELGERIARFVLDLWDAPWTRPLMLGLLRSAATDPVAAAMLRRVLAEGPFAAMARASDRPDADLRAALVGSQLVGLAMARYIVAVEPLASAPREVVARALGPTLQRYLVGELDDADGGMAGTARR